VLSTQVNGHFTAAHCEGINGVSDTGDGAITNSYFVSETINLSGDFEFQESAHWIFPSFYSTYWCGPPGNGTWCQTLYLTNDLMSYGAIGQNLAVCKSGRRNGTACGTVILTGQQYTYAWPGCGGCLVTIGNLALASGMNSMPGDSGGPVYQGNTAVGIISAGNPQAPGYTWFTPMETALITSGAALLVN